MVEQHPDSARQAAFARPPEAFEPATERRHAVDWPSPGPGEPVSAQLPSDIAFLVHFGFARYPLEVAAGVAANKGMAANEIIIARGLITREAYLATLACHVGAEFRADGPDPFRIQTLPGGDLLSPPPVRAVFETVPNGRLLHVAPQGAAVERTIELSQKMPDLFARVVLTPDAALRKAIFMRRRDAIVAASTAHLRMTKPAFSAANRMSLRSRAALTGLCIAGVGGLAFDFAEAAALFGATLSIFYLAVILLRTLLIARLDRLAPAARTVRMPRFSPRQAEDMPIYSVLVALYREAGQVGGLVDALAALQWPQARLEVFFVCEEDDLETVKAISRLALPPGFDVVVCPPCQPRTKPKALDFALPLCTGEFVVLYDAEDRPHPWQLREAFERFAAGSQNLVCLQAPLAIHNHGQNWLTSMFALEYAAQFLGMLPVLEGLGAPLPLGGTPNHFRGLR